MFNDTMSIYEFAANVLDCWAKLKEQVNNGTISKEFANGMANGYAQTLKMAYDAKFNGNYNVEEAVAYWKKELLG